METLKQLQKRQNHHLFNTAMGTPREQLFADYVSWHPNMYDGVDLDKATIDYINNYFYEYKVDCNHFHRHFMNALRHATPIYNNLKAVELSEKVFDIITNKSVRKLASSAVEDLKENGTIAKLRNDTGTITDSGTIAQTASENTTANNRYNKDTDNRAANRELPMKTSGSDFDDTVDWENGASNISENKIEEDSTENISENVGSSANTTTGNTRTLATTITNSDTNELTKLNNIDKNDKETIERITGQGVDLIKKIWNYLITPKAIDYIISELEESFITIY